jgi:xylose isomerase
VANDKRLPEVDELRLIAGAVAMFAIVNGRGQPTGPINADQAKVVADSAFHLADAFMAHALAMDEKRKAKP